MKLIVLILAACILLLTISGCPTNPALPKSAIFSDVIMINISPVSGSISSSSYFNYTLPEEVKYAIVELFSSDAVFTDNPEKKVPVDKLIAGSRTGFEAQGFTRSSVRVDELFPVNTDRTDFDTTGGYYSETVPTDYIWIVLGYDENMILTHASPAGEVTITWP